MEKQESYSNLVNGITAFLKTIVGRLFCASFLVSVILLLFCKLLSFTSIIITSYFFFSISVGSFFLLVVSYIFNSQWLISLRGVLLDVTRSALLFAPILFPLLIAPILKLLLSGIGISKHTLANREYIFSLIPLITTGVYLCMVLRFNKLFGLSLVDESVKLNLRRYSIIAIFVIGLSITVFAFYFVTTLQYSWFSGILGLYHFTAAVQASVALVYLFNFLSCIKPKSIQIFNETHFKNITTLIFVFSLLHAYTSYFQYVIVYSANMPIETKWYLQRAQLPYGFMYMLVVIGRIIIPFIVFLFKKYKTRHILSAFVCELIIIFHLYEIILWILPSSSKVNNYEIIVLLGLIVFNGIFFGAIYRNISRESILCCPEMGNSDKSIGSE